MEKLKALGPKAWVIITMAAWTAVALTLPLVHTDASGLTEGAARALLLNWSVSDRIITPITLMGVPDLRALLFAPLGLYWPGSILAVKVFTLLVTFLAVLLVYRWARDHYGQEAAMIAAGLLLIAPITFVQADTLGLAPYLLLLFAMGWRLEVKIDQAERPMGSWFYIRLLLIAITVTLHPAGLAYPAMVLLRNLRRPELEKKRKQQLAGSIVFTLAFMAVMQAGWVQLDWFGNPFAALGEVMRLPVVDDEPAWISAGILGLLAITLLFNERRALLDNPLLGSLGLSLVFGLAAADNSWAMLCLAFVLFTGIPHLIRLNGLFNGRGFVGQRGLVMVVMVVLVVLFSRVDKGYSQVVQGGLLSQEDQLLQLMAAQIEGQQEGTIIGSQWPARTTLACKCAVFPLPPAFDEAQQLLEKTRGLTHLLFNPYTKENQPLAANLSQLVEHTETLAITEAGSIVRFKTTTPTPVQEGKTTEQ